MSRVTKVTAECGAECYNDLRNSKNCDIGVELMKKKAYMDAALCVACGCSVTACKLGAVSVPKGVAARIDTEKCVGCGMCAKACPASVIEIKEVSHE